MTPDPGLGTAVPALRRRNDPSQAQAMGLRVNYKRVERLYQEAKLQVRRRKRKRVVMAERQRPATAVFAIRKRCR